MKNRLDVIMQNRGLAASRNKAQQLIKEGRVLVEGEAVSKPGAAIDELCNITVLEGGLKYVSRGGLKLEEALHHFDINLSGCVCIDIGSSTGGFTDCMLQNGASFVYSVDAGENQLDDSLRGNEKICLMEKTNFRYLDKGKIDRVIDFAACDVSFISLDKILPNAYELLKFGGLMVCLIKPQFEAGRSNIGKGGIVRDKKVHERVIKNVIESTLALGFNNLGVTDSPITGGDGNKEYLILLKKKDKEGV